MGELNMEELNGVIHKGLRMIVAVRRLAADVGLDRPELADLEREVRKAGGQTHRALMALLEASKRPVLEF